MAPPATGPRDVTIPSQERNEHLADKLAAEAPGILLWLVEGARIYLADGLSAPEAVRAATDGYRKVRTRSVSSWPMSSLSPRTARCRRRR